MTFQDQLEHPGSHRQQPRHHKGQAQRMEKSIWREGRAEQRGWSWAFFPCQPGPCTPGSPPVLLLCTSWWEPFPPGCPELQNTSKIPARALPTVWRSTQELWLPPSISSLGMDEMLCGKCCFCHSVRVCKGRSTMDTPIHPLSVRDFNPKLFCLKQSFPATFPLHLLFISHKSESSKANTRLLRFC